MRTYAYNIHHINIYEKQLFPTSVRPTIVDLESKEINLDAIMFPANEDPSPIVAEEPIINTYKIV